MPHRRSSKGKSFSVFRSAGEEACMKREEQSWENEGGHMSSIAGRVALTNEGELPFKVILTHDGGETTEHAFATMRECEAFIRRNTPPPAARSTLYDRKAGES